MDLFGDTLVGIEFKSIADGYFFTNEFSQNSEIHIIDSFPLSPGRHLILINGSLENLKPFFIKLKKTKSLTSKLYDLCLIEKIHESLFSGLYGLLKTELTYELLVIETKSNCSVLEITNKILSETDEISEILTNSLKNNNE